MAIEHPSSFNNLHPLKLEIYQKGHSLISNQGIGGQTPIFLLPLIHKAKEWNLAKCGTYHMFGLVGEIRLQGGQPMFISIVRNKASPLGLISTEQHGFRFYGL